MKHDDKNYEKEALAALALAYYSDLDQRSLNMLFKDSPAPTVTLESGPACWQRSCEELLREAKPPQAEQARGIFEALQRCQAELTWVGRPDYPRALYDLPNYPSLLFYRGQLALLSEQLIAIVGTRNARPDICHWTKNLAHKLAQAGWGTISGGALGIDCAALSGAQEARRPPVVVAGVPIDRLYPKESAALQQDIIEQGGLLVCEYAPTRPWPKHSFLDRNRLIAALSRGVLVAAAPDRSGALNTASWARRLRRPLMAVPLAPYDDCGHGTRRLIRSQATAVGTCEEVLACLGQRHTLSEAPKIDEGELAEVYQLNALEQKLLQSLAGTGCLVDQLIAACQVDAAAVSGALLSLELKGLIARQSGGLYRRAN